MTAHVGLDCTFYRNTGTWGSPTWNLIDLVRDASLNLEKNMADASSRLSRWRQKLPTLKEGKIEIKMLKDVSDADHDALRDAFLNDTLSSYAFADGAIATTGTQYFKGDFYVSKFAPGQPLEDAEVVDMTLELGYSSNAPTFTTVGS